MSESHTPVHLVLGATGGIGRALSHRLAATGARLVLAARTEEPLRALGDELGADVHMVDATDVAAVEQLVRAVTSSHGRIDGAANCVGSLLLKPAHLTSGAEFATTIAQNLTSAFALVRAAARPMMDAGVGSIALCSSAAAVTGLANHEAIAAAKAGVAGLTRSAAATYGARGVRVNAVAPGLVRTPLTARVTGNPAGEKASLAMHALPRLGEPDDVAYVLAWLLGSDSSWVTGQVIGVDGGLGTVRPR